MNAGAADAFMGIFGFTRTVPAGITGTKQPKENEMEATTIEQDIKATGLNAPRVTPERIAEVIEKEEYHRLTDVLTVCVITLVNGFTVTGESACASPENFDEAIGQKIARAQAVGKIWMLEGYLLKQNLYLAAG